jgi:hypothetical protein
VKSGGATATRDAQLRDDELAKMQRELDGLNARAEQARNTSSEQARQAKQQLDGAMEAFGKEIASAGTLFPGNPEVTAYIDSAQRLLETTRGVIADMTRRQEKQFNDLMELKARLNEKMEARRDEQWQADKELQDLTERLAILTRQYNAAVGGGLKREAEEKKAEVELTQSMIKARQELIPADPGYADAIRQIEQFIDSTKKNIEEDRTRTDALLVQLQKSFTSGPQVANLPADQRELAKRLQDKLASINAARQQYNRSLDAGAARVSDETLAQQIAALQAGIEARKKLLAEQQGEAAAQAPEALKQKQIELDNLKQNQKKAEDAYFAARQELDNTRRATADATATLEKLQKLEDQRKLLEQSLKTQNDTLVSKQRDLTTAVYPEQPGDNDVRIVEGTDRRLTYAAVAGGSIFLLFSALITLTLQRAARFGPATSVAPADLRPIQHPHPQPSASNGNGATHDDDEDERPAVV